MFDYSRQQHQGYEPDPKGSEAAGTMMGWSMVFVGVLWIIQYIYTALSAWYHQALQWFAEVWAYIGSFWPF